ncbi:MAG: LysR family transcriptional regulator [Chitinophagaceae bacterium]|nr:LysR family transcriptional regulator [Chitinophagaceae bacterium]
MNFNQLKYIVAVEKLRSFAKAADECGIAQSTLSKEIQRLEKEFGIMIFDRSRLPVTPTMKGEDLIKQAKIILEDHKQFVDIANKKDNLPKGKFRLGILPALAPYLVPLFVNSLSEKYPDLQTGIIEMGIKEMAQSLQNEELDGGIAIKPFLKEGFYEDVLFEEKFVIYIGLNHPLAARSEIAWNDIHTEDLILQEDLRDHFLQPDYERKESVILPIKIPNIRFQSGSLETIRKIIDLNGGMTLLPQLSTLYMGARRLKMVRPLIHPVVSRTIILVTPRGFEKNRITKVIKREIINSLPSP